MPDTLEWYDNYKHEMFAQAIGQKHKDVIDEIKSPLRKKSEINSLNKNNATCSPLQDSFP